MTPRSAESSNERTGGERGGGESGGAILLTASAIAELTGGKVRGDANASISSVASLDHARSGQLSFCASSKYARLLRDTQASVVLVSPDVADVETRASARIVVDQPHDSIISLLPRLYRAVERTPGLHPTAVIGRNVKIGADAVIGPYVYVGDAATLGDRVTLEAHCSVGAGVRLGDDVRLFHGATLYSGTQLGNRVWIHAGARIGSDGFGYVYKNGRHEKIPHVGRCVIEDDVEIGANTTIDRGSIDDTMVGAGTKIDNLVHVAHNVRIGRLCLIAAQTGISGSVRVEDGVVMGGQVGVSGHHTVGKGAKLAAQAGVFGDIPAGETWSGYPARPHRESLRAHAALFKLSTMLKRLEKLLGDGGADADRSGS